ncbi:glypican-1-like [Xenentodon cancila]
MDSLIIAALALCSLAAPVYGDKGTSKARSCSDIKQFFQGKGIPVENVPKYEISGEHLRICPQGYTCCTSEMEDNLATLSRSEVEKILKDVGRNLHNALGRQYKDFDGYFTELLNRSAVSLQETFTSTWGPVYVDNSQVFSDLYSDLTLYYRSANVNLEEVLNEFWAKLLERLFNHANKQYSIGEDYLDCVSKQIETLRPFGDTSRILTTKVTHSFVATRSFIQGLVISGEVVRKVSQVPLSQECMRAMMKMTYCPQCRGMPSARPCANYCSNVMKGCLANQADLNTEWRHLADTMIDVAERRLDDFDSLILSLPNQISEAMSTMMENIDTINSKLFQACGNLRNGGTSSTKVKKVIKRSGFTVEDSLGDSSKKLATLVSDVIMRLKDMKPYWSSLAKHLCSDRVANGEGAEEKCWNGISRARYLPEVMGDGLASQINNPEVEIDITKPDTTIRQQIMQLKIMTHRLKNALNGQDVDFLDSSDDASGSGSGMCIDGMCPRGPALVPSTVRTVAYPPPEKETVKASGQKNLPSISIYLLSLLILLLWR